MGGVLEKVFVNPAAVEAPALPKIIFLMAVYGFILFKGSNLVSDGSELLLLIPSLAGIVGSVILPVLGAVPDCLIVLFSGMGPREEAQEQLSVGVGALAGSTIMLLTLPWFLTLWAGRVTLDKNGRGHYSRKTKLDPAHRFNIWTTGVNLNNSVKISSMVMIITTSAFFIIQGPAFAYNCSRVEESCDSAGEKWFALGGLVLCVIGFIGNIVWQIITANKQSNKDKIVEVTKDAISNSLISASAAFASQLFGAEALVGDGEAKPLVNGGNVSGEGLRHFEAVLKTFFTRHDVDRNGTLEATEMRTLLAELGERPSKEEFEKLMTEMDKNRDGVIQFDEFKTSMVSYARKQYARDLTGGDEGEQVTPAPSDIESTSVTPTNQELLEEEKEEEDEMPEDLQHLSPRKQKLLVLWRAAWQMSLGVALLILFSDPMVDTLSAFGKQVGIPPFYIAFVLAPLASNASEIIASFHYAQKKTVKTSTISCESLIGAATMNNTFCLGTFMCLIFFRDLAWTFSAETIAILLVEVLVLAIATRGTQRLIYGPIGLLLYPLSLALVWGLEQLGYN